MESSDPARDTAWAMSEENVELVRRVFTLWNRAAAGEEQALDIAAECFDADVEWHDQRELPGATVHHGIEEVGQHLAASQEALDYDRVDPLELLDADRRVLAAYRIRARGRSSGAPVERNSFHVYTFREGKIASVEIFGTRSEALEAAGLSE
jgi:ketosteroid isomerase-like protein